MTTFDLATSPICDACRSGNHPACDIWACGCLHDGCPDQLTIDDALEDR